MIELHPDRASLSRTSRVISGRMIALIFQASVGPFSMTSSANRSSDGTLPLAVMS
jgi:hypothetical protein